ncbi:MAG: M20/M25/M40 family metallo-hydrolase [Actinomycetota bacterium]|nr:M20/M25/M40 family metallo-hydrolase [Actinomycetota bacterium]
METNEGMPALGPLDTQALAAEVDERWERDALPVLERYVEIPCLSPSFDAAWADHGHLDQAAELLRGFCAARAIPGVHAEIVRLGGRSPVVVVEVPATDPARAATTTLLYGHFDKQPPLGSWRAGLGPFTAVREGDRLYGRGAADDGYASFAAMVALESLAATGTRHGRCVLLAEASEESGSPDLPAYVEHLADRLGDVRLVCCLDSGGLSFDRLWTTSSLRGNVNGVLEVQVLDVGVHSGMAGGIVPDSFRIARQLLSRLEDEQTGELRLQALHVEVPEHRRHEIAELAEALGGAAAESFPTVAGLELTGASVAERRLAGTWSPSLTVIGAAGLPALEDAGNVLRPSTSLMLSFRLPPTCDAEAATAAISRALTADPPAGARVRFVPGEPGQGWDAPPAAPWLARASREASLAYFGAPPGVAGVGGSIPFMASLGHRFPGTQFLATGVLGPGSNEHGPDESLHLPTAKAVTASVAHVLASLPAER